MFSYNEECQFILKHVQSKIISDYLRVNPSLRLSFLSSSFSFSSFLRSSVSVKKSIKRNPFRSNQRQI